MHEQLRETLFFVDGFTHDDLNNDHGFLGAFNLLATSSQYRVKGDDFKTQCILLPAWRPEDLKGFLKAALKGSFSSDQLEEQVKEKFENPYFYSGGNLRLFLDSHVSRKNLINNAVSAVEKAGSDVLLREGKARTRAQLDLLRKRFLRNHNDREHYVTRAEWVTAVDSVFAFGELRGMISLEVILTILIVARGVGGGFYQDCHADDNGRTDRRMLGRWPQSRP
jgi:hypothetical protein